MPNIQLTQELVKSIFDYKDGFLYWRINTGFKRYIGKQANALLTRKTKNGIYNRYTVGIYGNKYLCARIIFLWHNGYIPNVVDHENHNTLDDRIENLRAASSSQNNKNKTSVVGSTSIYLGVFWEKNCSRWRVKIRTNNKNKHIGVYKTQEQAALAYNREAVRYHKEFANLNIIKYI